MAREAGTTRERVTKALLARYAADQDEALVKIDALLTGEVVPGHEDVTGSIDKQLAKVASAAEKMATLRQHYGTNQARRFTHSTKTYESDLNFFLFQIERKTLKVMIYVGITS